MPTENLVIRASMRDEVSGPARRIKGEIAGVGTTARAAGRGTGAFSTALSRVGRGAGRVGAVLRGGVAAAFRVTGIAAAVAGAGLLLLGRNSIRAAADAGETQAKFDTVFGGLRDSVQGWVDGMHANFGVATADLQDATAAFAVFGKQAGITGQPLADFTTDLTQAGLDLSSFYNVAADGDGGTFAAIRSGLAGEIEPLRRFGIFLSDAAVVAEGATMGLTGALTDQQKVGIRQRLILRQLGDANGDLERTADSAANQARKLSGYWADFQVTLGRMFLPVVTSVVRALNDKLGPVTLRLSRNMDKLKRSVHNGNWPRVAHLIDNVAGAHGRLEPFILRAIRVIRNLARIVRESVLPALGTFAGIVAAVVAPAVDLIADGIKWLARHSSILRPVLVGVAVALAAIAIFTSPVLSVVAAFVALVAVVRTLYRRFAGVRQAVRVVSDGFGDLVGAVADFIGGLDFAPAAAALRPLLDAVSELGDAMGGWNRVLPIVGGIVAAVALLAGGPVVAVLAVAAAAVYLYSKFSKVRTVVDAVARFHLTKLVPAFLTVDRVIVGVLGAAIRFMVAGWRRVISALRAVWNATRPLRSALAAVARFLGRVAAVSLSGIVAAVRKLWRYFAPVRSIVAGVVRILGRLGMIALAVVIGAVIGLTRAVRAAWRAAKPVRTVLAAIGRMALGTVKAAISGIATGLKLVWDKAQPARDIIGAIGRMGLSQLKGAVDGVRSAFDAVKAAVQWLLDKIPSISLPDLPSWVPVAGDTASPHTSPGSAGRVTGERLAAAGYAAGITPGRQTVTSSLRAGGSGDHSRGAVDFAGPNLPTLAANVTAAGGFAELHGSGPSRHLHTVAAAGDTFGPRAGFGATAGYRPRFAPGFGPRPAPPSRPAPPRWPAETRPPRPASSSPPPTPPRAGGTVVLEAGAVTVTSPASPADIERAVRRGIARALRQAEDRD